MIATFRFHSIQLFPFPLILLFPRSPPPSMFSSFGALVLATAFTSVLAATAGGFEDGGDTLVSAMMVSRGSVSFALELNYNPLLSSQMFLGNEDSIYILDKAELNPATINGHPAWGSLWYVSPCINLALLVYHLVFFELTPLL